MLCIHVICMPMRYYDYLLCTLYTLYILYIACLHIWYHEMKKNRNIYSSVLIDKLNWIGLYSVNTIYLPNNKIYSNQYLHCNCIWFSSTTNKLLAVLYRRQWTGIYEWKNIWMSRKMKDFKRIVSFEEKKHSIWNILSWEIQLWFRLNHDMMKLPRLLFNIIKSIRSDGVCLTLIIT